MKTIVDSISNQNSINKFQNLFSVNNLFFLVFAYSFTWFINNFFEQIKNLFSAIVYSRFESSILSSSLNSFLKISKKEQDKLDIGVFHTDVSRASDAFATLNITIFFVLLPMLIQLIFMSFILYKNINLNFSIIFTIGVIIIFILSNKINKKSGKYYEPFYNSHSKLHSYFIQKINHAYDIKINHSYNFEGEKFNKNLQSYVKENTKSHVKIGTLMILQTFFIFIFLLSFLEISIHYLSLKEITSGDFVMISSYIIMLTTPFLMISQHITLINGHFVSLNKVYKYFSLEKEKTTMESYHYKNYFFQFKNSSIYLGDKLIKNFNLKILENKTYLIVGKTGIGKSTIVNYMLGLYKLESGHLYYKDLDITKSYSTKIFNEVAFVSQSNSLFSGTLKENLIYNSPYQYSDDELLTYLQKFDLIEILNTNKFTLNDDMTEILKSFSGGEKQRLNIIRALLKKPTLLILDEPTSALDEDTAIKVMNYIQEHVHSLIIITHSRHLIQKYDHIIDIEEIIKRHT